MAKEAYTPKITHVVQYRDPKERASTAVAPASSLTRPNYEDILRRVSVVIHQHITKCETTLARTPPDKLDTGLFHVNKIHRFAEDLFTSPQYAYTFLRAPVMKMGFLYGIRKVERELSIPTLAEVHTFLRDLFVKAQLSAECSIGATGLSEGRVSLPLLGVPHPFCATSLPRHVFAAVCLIYVERLMEHANVPLVTKTWRPCLLCGLLLASKVWQDLRCAPFHSLPLPLSSLSSFFATPSFAHQLVE
jgi:hypothetical protein